MTTKWLKKFWSLAYRLKFQSMATNDQKINPVPGPLSDYCITTQHDDMGLTKLLNLASHATLLGYFNAINPLNKLYNLIIKRSGITV